MKPSSALLTGNKPFYYPEFTKEIHYELEVVLRVGRNGRHVQPEFAHKYFTEIALGIDFTARDIQRVCKEKGHPWEMAKAFDHSAVVSPFVPITEIDNLQAMEFQLLKNGTVVQHGNTKEMIFSFTDLLVYVSKYFKLLQGDYIFTGTPAGVGEIAIGDLLEGVLMTKNGKKSMFSCQIS